MACTSLLVHAAGPFVALLNVGQWLLNRHLMLIHVTDASGNASVEQQQTLDVMKRILEIKRMVTEGTASGGQQNGPQGSDDPSKAAEGEGKAGSLDRAAAENADNEQCGQVWTDCQA